MWSQLALDIKEDSISKKLPEQKGLKLEALNSNRSTKEKKKESHITL
jgi:hypothetical protein